MAVTRSSASLNTWSRPARDPCHVPIHSETELERDGRVAKDGRGVKQGAGLVEGETG